MVSDHLLEYVGTLQDFTVDLFGTQGSHFIVMHRVIAKVVAAIQYRLSHGRVCLEPDSNSKDGYWRTGALKDI